MKLTRAPEHDPTTVAVAFATHDSTSGGTVAVPPSGIDLEAVERALIVFALTSSGNRTRAARFLGLSRSALIYRIHKHGIATGAVTGEKR